MYILFSNVLNRWILSQLRLCIQYAYIARQHMEMCQSWRGCVDLYASRDKRGLRAGASQLIDDKTVCPFTFSKQDNCGKNL